MGTSSQQYCLRWNNHRTNLLTVFDELLRSEAFTDVTLACEGGISVKCHKMVLAACSSYFQSLFTELPCRHPVVVLKDVKYSEMKAILEYMYRGEVNVAQDQLAALLKVAEVLKVKGLVEDRVAMSGTPKEIPQSRREENHSPPTSGASQSTLPHSSSSTPPPHSSSTPYEKPTYNTYTKTPLIERNNRLSIPMWAVPGLPFSHHSSSIPPPNHHHAATSTLLNSCYDPNHPDMSPLKRKKLQSLLMSRDTPILRTVLGQGQQADSSQPMSLVCTPDSHERIHSNGSTQETERANLKVELSLDEERSPYTDLSVAEEDSLSDVKPGKLMMSQSYTGAVSSGIATYVPTQKPEWKRYKQYTRNDIMSAIDAVRNGMSALQAARKYGVPSRTLYDKVKKMGITTSRPFNKRGNNSGTGSSPYFQYNYSGTNSIGGMFGGGDGEEQMPNQPPGLMEPLFLQHALEGMKREIADHGGISSSPGENGHSPSPGKFNYRHNSLTPSPGDEDEEDRVEDLSITRKPEPMRVIMPPMSSSKRDDEEINTGHPEEHRPNSLETTDGN